MRALRLVMLPLLVPTSLAAQYPTSHETSAPAGGAFPVAIFFDPEAVLAARPRLGLEIRLAEAWTATLTASRALRSSVTVDSGVALYCLMLCRTGYRGTGTRYSAWSLEAAVRHYPIALTFDRARSLVALYVGAFIGYYRSTKDQPQNWTTGSSPRKWPSPDQPIADPQPLPAPGLLQWPSARRATTWDGGPQIGVRLMPRAPVFIDVTGSFTWATIGRWVSRFDAVIGVGW